MSFDIQAIGQVKNSITDDRVVENWGSVVSEIHISEDLADGLNGLEDWSHIVVIFYMHETTFSPERHLLSRPQHREDMPEVGIFAQRSRSHPNTIGISAVKIIKIEGNVIEVKGLDAISGTPVLDIKPYAPVFDGAHDPLIPGWFIRLMQGYF